MSESTRWTVERVAREVVLTLPILNEAVFVVKGDRLVVSLTPDEADRMGNGLRQCAEAQRGEAVK